MSVSLTTCNRFDQHVVITKLRHFYHAICLLFKHEPQLTEFRLAHNIDSCEHLLSFTLVIMARGELALKGLIPGNVTILLWQKLVMEGGFH